MSPSDDRRDTAQLLPFQSELVNHFVRPGRQVSAFLYGSAATGNWVSTRSDLDLLILVPADLQGWLSERIDAWKSSPGHPYLDGFALFSWNGMTMAKRLDEFQQPARLAHEQIQLIDLWIIKNRSKLLFGEDFVCHFPQISVGDLSAWARRQLKAVCDGSPGGEVPVLDVVLSQLIWSVSWSARMLLLSKGTVCESKREALVWLSQQHPDTAVPVGQLLDDYLKSDEEPTAITPEQSAALRGRCLELMRHEIEPGSL